MGKHAGLIERNGWYYHHVRVPTKLVQAIGKRFITKSLGTKDRKIAIRELRKKAEEADQLFDYHRVKLDADEQAAEAVPVAGASFSFAEIARQYGREVSDREFEFRADLFEGASAAPSKLWSGDLIELPESSYFDHLIGEGDLDAVIGFIARNRIKNRVLELRKALATGGLGALIAIAEERSPGIDRSRALILARFLARAEIDALNRIVEGESDASVEFAMEEPPAKSSAGSASGPLLSAVMAEWVAEKDRTNAWTEKTRWERESAVKAFIEVCEDRPVDAYGKADARRFKDILFAIPPNAHKRLGYRDLGLVARAEKAEKEGAPRPTAKNVSIRMDAVSSLFIWARQNYDEAPNNPFEGVKPKINTTPREERDPFTADELRRIFQAPPFTGAKSESGWLQPGDTVLDSTGKYWLPLIALYSGMRLMEIAQLRKCDVKTEHGVTFFDVNGEDGKRLKTRSSIRRIPVHPALVRAGFLDLVQNVKEAKDRLFDDIPLGGAKNFSSPASKLFVRLIKAVGVKTRKNCFHSFRHCFEDACRHAEVDIGVMNALQGHSERGMAGRYGAGHKLERLHAEISKVRFGLELEG